MTCIACGKKVPVNEKAPWPGHKPGCALVRIWTKHERDAWRKQ